MPVPNASNAVIGVLTASTTLSSGGDLGSEEVYYDLLGRALLIARALIDLLKWFTDD